ncbi:MAG: ABC transporter permease, partial [Gaiellales bacterium]
MSSAGSFAWKVVGRWEALLVLLILVVGYWCTTLSPFFLTRLNLLDLVTPYIFLGLLAFGLTFVVVSGEIDISVCSVMAVSAVS